MTDSERDMDVAKRILFLVAAGAAALRLPGEQAKFAGLCLLSLFAVLSLPAWLRRKLTLVGTYTHELCHGLAGVGSGGRFGEFVVDSSGGGLCYVGGGTGSLVSCAGYLGTVVTGCALAVVSARPEMGMEGSVVAVSFFALGTIKAADRFTAAVGLAVAGLTAAASAYVGSGFWLRLLVNFLGIALIWEGFDAIRCLCWVSLRYRGTGSDAEAMAARTGLPTLIWSVLFFATGAGCVLVAAAAALRLAG